MKEVNYPTNCTFTDSENKNLTLENFPYFILYTYGKLF